MCNLVFCLLLKTSLLSSLPDIQQWEEHMDADKNSDFPIAPLDNFLVHCDFGKELIAGKTSGMVKLRTGCREFINRLPPCCWRALKDFGFQSRRHRFRVFKLCCLIVGEPSRVYPSLSIDLSGCGLTKGCVQLFQNGTVLCAVCWLFPLVLLYRAYSGFRSRCYCRCCVFFVGSDFDLWKDLCDPGV